MNFLCMNKCQITLSILLNFMSFSLSLLFEREAREILTNVCFHLVDPVDSGSVPSHSAAASREAVKSAYCHSDTSVTTG